MKIDDNGGPYAKKTIGRWLFAGLVALGALVFLVQTRQILVPFLGGLFLAYVLAPLVERLEKRAGLKRLFAALLILAGSIGFLVLALLFLLPKFYADLGTLLSNLTVYGQNLAAYALSWQAKWQELGLPSAYPAALLDRWLGTSQLLEESLQGILTFIPRWLTALGYLILVPCLALYFLLDWPKLAAYTLHLVPSAWQTNWRRFLDDVDLILRGFIRGNLTLSLIVGFASGIGVSLLGMGYGLLVGMVCGISNLIPIFGPFLGGIPVVLLALSHSPFMALKVALLLGVIQQVESQLLQPKIMGEKLGLHPLWVIFVLLGAGEIAGVGGMILVVPIAAILKRLGHELYLFLVEPSSLVE